VELDLLAGTEPVTRNQPGELSLLQIRARYRVFAYFTIPIYILYTSLAGMVPIGKTAFAVS
jgi:hypothetical protein